MDFNAFMVVWEEFLHFLDRAVQWLQYVFGGDDTSWPPDPYPDIDAEKK